MIQADNVQPFDAAGIKAFIADDCVINPFFVGRDDIMGRMHELAKRVNERRWTYAGGAPAEG